MIDKFLKESIESGAERKFNEKLCIRYQRFAWQTCSSRSFLASLNNQSLISCCDILNYKWHEHTRTHASGERSFRLTSPPTTTTTTTYDKRFVFHFYFWSTHLHEKMNLVYDWASEEIAKYRLPNERAEGRKLNANFHVVSYSESHSLNHFLEDDATRKRVGSLKWYLWCLQTT